MHAKTKTVLFTLLGFGLLWLWQYNENRTADNDATVTDPVALSLEKAVMYQYDQHGILKNRLSGKYIEHMKNGENHFVSPELSQITAHGNRILKAKFGVLSADQQTVSLREHVFAEERNNGSPVAILHTDRLQYDRRRQIITSDSAVIFDTPESHTTADGAQWLIPQNLFILKKNIRSTYAPAL